MFWLRLTNTRLASGGRHKTGKRTKRSKRHVTPSPVRNRELPPLGTKDPKKDFPHWETRHNRLKSKHRAKAKEAIQENKEDPRRNRGRTNIPGHRGKKGYQKFRKAPFLAELLLQTIRSILHNRRHQLRLHTRSRR